jgi:toxin secretion/phage lysis holin
MRKIIDTCATSISTIINFIISMLIVMLGKYWYIFIFYMIFNILDWVTGSLKAIRLKEVSSYIGIKGLIKKIGYWIVIGIAFSFSSIFVILGKEILGINLSIMYLLGWFTLASLITNEIVSILENLVLLNIKVPDILINSLKVTQKVLDNASEKILNKDNIIDVKSDKNKKSDK